MLIINTVKKPERVTQEANIFHDRKCMNELKNTTVTPATVKTNGVFSCNQTADIWCKLILKDQLAKTDLEDFQKSTFF